MQKNKQLLSYRTIQCAFYIIVLTCILLPVLGRATSCTVSTVSVNFGTYNVYATTALQTTGQITVTCNPVSTSYIVALNGGTYGTITQRKQSSGSDLLLYNLYTDPARTVLWGDGSTSGVTVTSSGLTPLTVYGVIPAQQDVSAGAYSDNVSVTVSF